MFEVGFWELVLLFVLGLVVLGPEKLPRVANQLGRYVGQARRMASTLTTQIRSEFEAEEQRILSREARGKAAPPAPPPQYSRPGIDELRTGPADDQRSHADAGADDPAPPFRADPPAPGQP